MRSLLVCGLIAVLGAGCASSERMNRMSGGVFQEYSAPKSYRIRSQKFQAKTRALEKAGIGTVGGVEGTPVNVWPFFFSSDSSSANSRAVWSWLPATLESLPSKKTIR